ncbi:MAG TPA: VOC family protein [bacterium]|nr:VOC family protein [bacterium]
MDTSGKIDYIEIRTKDLQKTKTFFQQLFGWKFQDYGPDYTAFDDGRMKGGFYPARSVASVAAGSTLVVFYTPSLEDYEKKVVNLGGKIVKAIFSFPGGRRFHFTDPGGSEFALWSDK